MEKEAILNSVNGFTNEEKTAPPAFKDFMKRIGLSFRTAQKSSLSTYYSKCCNPNPKTVSKVSSLVIPPRIVTGGSIDYDGGFRTNRHKDPLPYLTTQIVNCFGPGCVAYLKRTFPKDIVFYDGKMDFPLNASKRIAIPGKFLNVAIKFIGPQNVKQVFLLDSRFENSIFISE